MEAWVLITIPITIRMGPMVLPVAVVLLVDLILVGRDLMEVVEQILTETDERGRTVEMEPMEPMHLQLRKPRTQLF